MGTDLGKNQRAILRTLREFEYYRNGGRWVWSNHSSTVRLLDSLVQRGLVVVTMEEVHSIYKSTPYKAETWRLTPAGKEQA